MIDEDEVGLKEKPEDNRYNKLHQNETQSNGSVGRLDSQFCHCWQLQTRELDHTARLLLRHGVPIITKILHPEAVYTVGPFASPRAYKRSNWPLSQTIFRDLY